MNKRYHHEGTVFGSQNMDLGKVRSEVQQVRDQKKYLQSSHIKMSMRKYDDQFKSMNSKQREVAAMSR
eukprot:CAMPEP_0170511544 /NCGR_PEP_ID=MMETSP0208-20121228/66362_1 /TAXON_ID=197538 /ORGANISM="Strombidium inclinatum, Strain S3" /LENGTH=67 /DNA_ID=CAMNT_0010795095 /DNA_START=273 /DNA_END=476 /DNA_ORIENTATION=+